MSPLGIDVGSIFEPETVQTLFHKSSKSGQSGLLVSEASSVRSLVLLVPWVSLSGSRCLGRPMRLSGSPHEDHGAPRAS